MKDKMSGSVFFIHIIALFFALRSRVHQYHLQLSIICNYFVYGEGMDSHEGCDCEFSPRTAWTEVYTAYLPPRYTQTHGSGQ